ncbi:hypothetical protein E4H12_03415 [Candidatus Thorarchaeota archaeon]|nr:hypothetical protein [Candidatus Thorarchaeota archaeon]TFG99242.1 MAG: hypothetical protein E4H12_03415 [Candidatus Thorarchaeota archaeon]
MKQIIIGLLLIIHGLFSTMFMFDIENPPEPGVGWDGTSWLLTGILDPSIIQMLGTLLWGLTVLTFVVAGIFVLMKKE